ncbi:MAG: helix-turn-helix transcriptional regulator [Pseudomonadales bacterium]|nr:helix-turn-helix transcriptional regulator [Pseudomonadales bacterium]
MSEKTTRSSCPVNFSLELFGDKWSLLIVRDMLFRQLQNYGDFLSSPERISTNILANRLKQLEGNGLIQKFPDPSDRKKYIYLLTEKGEDLLPVLLEMIRWGIKYSDKTAVPQEIRRRLESDIDGFIKETRTAIRDKRDALLNSHALVT